MRDCGAVSDTDEAGRCSGRLDTVYQCAAGSDAGDKQKGSALTGSSAFCGIDGGVSDGEVRCCDGAATFFSV